MRIIIEPGSRTGSLAVPSSKSQAHRYLICAALSENPSLITCRGISDDILATIRCLNALGAKIEVRDGSRISVSPVRELPSGQADLYCGESGSTLHFLLPVCGALGIKAVFHMEGRLPERTPQSFLDEMALHGMHVTLTGSRMECEGKLRPGEYRIPGDISSQFISGMLLALPLLRENSVIRITGGLKSGNYVIMTEEALNLSHIRYDRNPSSFNVYGGRKYDFPAEADVEGDWSQAAFFLCMGALSGQGVTVKGLSGTSSQGDRKILDLLEQFGAIVRVSDEGVSVRKGSLNGITIDAGEIPDLIPAVSVLAAAASGKTTVTNAARLRLKESDRLNSICKLLQALGAEAEETEDGLVITGKRSIAGGNAGMCRDHRIAMAAAVAACFSETAVRVEDAECIGKSYPAFWSDLEKLAAEQK